MKVFYLRFVGLIIILFTFFYSSTAQRSSGIAVQGKITVQQGSVEGAVIQMYMDGRRLDDYGVGADGNYKVELLYNHKYELIFVRKDNFPQKIAVDATLPREVQNSDPFFPPFPVDVALFTEIPGVDKSFSENTILKIFYSADVDNFISETYYNDAQIAKLIEQAILQSQMIDKESDYLSKLTRAEQAEIRREYNQLLEQAAKEYGNEQFLAALDGYKAASQLMPKEQFPKDRIAEINDLLGLMMAAAELDKAKLDRFNALIAEADQLFNQKQYQQARSSYNRALSIKPTDQHATQRVKEIGDILRRQIQDEQYDDLIAQADNSMRQLLYDDAINRLNEALKIKPNETYPTSKLEEINGILAKQAKDIEKQESYREAMLEGNTMFDKQFYDKALSSFENALKFVPGDEAATTKIANVRKIMKEIADKMMFDELIKSADKSFKKKEYEAALTDYTEAAAILPNDAYANKQIEEINQILQLVENFSDLVFKADNQFINENYEASKSLYQKALELKSDDKHSQDRIAEIDGILAEKGLDDKYDALIAQADGLLNQQDYANAKNRYNEALAVKPKEKYPKDKIGEIDALLQQIVRTDQDYQRVIARADELLAQKDYEKAKAEYVNAGNIKPDETYPPEMIAKVDGLIAEQIRLAEEAEAEKQRLAEEAAEAEAARLAAIQAEKDKNYSDAIARANDLFNQKEYENARTEYRAAFEIKPEETVPQQKIEEIGSLLAQLSAAQKAYEDAIAKADREFIRDGFDAAIAAYNEAKTAKPEESYPDEQLAKIDSIVTTRARLAEEAAEAEAARLAAIQAEKDKNYSDAIARADELFNQKEYENARTEYRAALEIKPEETIPQQKIEEIGSLLAQLSAAQKAYEDAIAKADREFTREGFDAAIAAYNEAKTAKPEESYPDEQLAKIDSIVTTRARLAEEAAAAEAARLAAIQAEKDKNYSDAIARADDLFNQKEYENARTEYRAALEIKPEETIPQQKIEEIGSLLAQLSAAQKAYEEAIAKADREFNREGFDAAIAAYNEAKTAKPEESYPDEQLAKIDSIVTTRARLAEEAAEAEAARLAAIQAEKDKNYSDAIARADELFNQKEYENARTEYRAALEIKPEETIPQQKIEEIGSLLAQLSAAQKAYEDAIAKADREFNREGFDAAIAAYNEAKTAKPEESYPDEQLAKIDSIVTTRARLAEEAAAAEAARLAAIQAEKDKNYSDAIARADELFNQKEYENARTEYRAALEIKPEETIPQQKIEEIGSLLAQLSAAQKAYEDAIAKADREFTREGFDAAIAAYNEAKTAKPEESYPDEQLAKIDSIVTTRARLAEEAAAAEAARLTAIQAEKDKNYSDAIARADDLFNQKEYENARTEYRSALTIKPEESYPQQRIDEIGTLLAQLEQERKAKELLDKNYNDLIAQADRFFTAKTYDQSKAKYTDALGLKPEEAYPKERISEIDNILAQQAIDEKYRTIIVAADGYFRTENYLQAKTDYENALGLKPQEAYPKNQISKIDDILQKEQQRILAERETAEDLQRRTDEIAQMNNEIEALELESEAEITDLYNQYVKQADTYFDTKQYNISRGWYYKAWDIKPNETYPPQKIAEINRLVGGLLSTQRDRDYQRYIDLADSTFRANEYAVARGWYNQALGVKANEVYPRNQLTEIEKKVAERLAGQSGQQFDENVEKASNAFDQRNYNVARFWYKKALELRPNDDGVKSRLAEIENIIR